MKHKVVDIDVLRDKLLNDLPTVDIEGCAYVLVKFSDVLDLLEEDIYYADNLYSTWTDEE